MRARSLESLPCLISDMNQAWGVLAAPLLGGRGWRCIDGLALHSKVEGK